MTPRKVKPARPEGLLQAQQWLALVRLYELDFEGLPADDEQGLSYEGISSKTLELLREQGLVIGSPIAQPLPAKRYTITGQGREFYYLYYRTNALAYHWGHGLPRPVLTAEQRFFWQRMEELSIAKTKAIGPTKETHEAGRREMLRFQFPTKGEVGLKTVARTDAPALTLARLAWVQQSYVRVETLTAANTCLVDAQAVLPLVQEWGGHPVTRRSWFACPSTFCIGMPPFEPARHVVAGVSQLLVRGIQVALPQLAYQLPDSLG